MSSVSLPILLVRVLNERGIRAFYNGNNIIVAGNRNEFVISFPTPDPPLCIEAMANQIAHQMEPWDKSCVISERVLVTLTTGAKEWCLHVAYQ